MGKGLFFFPFQMYNVCVCMFDGQERYMCLSSPVVPNLVPFVITELIEKEIMGLDGWEEG